MDDKIKDIYQSQSTGDQQASYDAWAAKYEQDLCAMGYRIPALAAGAVARFVPLDTAPILDAGCGGGIQAEPLVQMGYGPVIGMDLSDGMLEVARAKGIYAELHQGALGEQLDFEDNSMGAVLCIGTITPQHAPPESFEGLIRAAKTGALIIFSLRDDPAQDPEYPAFVQSLTDEGRWEELWSSPSFQSMPYGAPEVTHRLHVYRKC